MIKDLTGQNMVEILFKNIHEKAIFLVIIIYCSYIMLHSVNLHVKLYTEADFDKLTFACDLSFLSSRTSFKAIASL